MTSVRKVAVIDIGSNSCRMVIYEQSGAALIPYFNEKAMAGLGRDLPETGNLSKKGKTLALKTFHRFRAITASLGIRDVRVVATAAVRDAKDGPAFKREAEAILKTPVRVLSGADEGRLSALGVQVGTLDANGLIADLGGTSMELRGIGPGLAGESFLLGPLARHKDGSLSLEKRRKAIAKVLAQSDLLSKTKGLLYAVGGAWRNVANVHMMLTDYPLRVVQSYRLDLAAIRKVIAAVEEAKSNRDLKDRLIAVSKRRFETLLHAALVLEVLLASAKAPAVIISSYGLRDGVVTEDRSFSGTEALLDAVPLFLRSPEEAVAFGKELYSFIHPISHWFDQSEAVLRATCLMADAGARMHPDHRAQLVHQQVLRAPVPGMSHDERLFAGFAVACRYMFKFETEDDLRPLMSSNMRKQARMLGTAMRLGSVYAGRSGPILATARLKADADTLTLSVDPAYGDLVSATVERRLGQLAGLRKLDAGLVFDEA